MIRTDATVTGPMADEAYTAAGDLDVDDAIRWIETIEPAVAWKIRAAGQKTLKRLGQQPGPALSDAQTAAVRRAVCLTAIGTTIALLEGRHNLWQDLVTGPLATSLDPWVGVRRQVVLHDVDFPKQPKKKRPRGRRVSNADGTTVLADKLSITRCQMGKYVSPKTPVLLLESMASDRSVRHEAVSLADGESLLKALVHGLAHMGCKAAAAAWPAVCGPDPALDPPRPPGPRGTAHDVEDGEGPGRRCPDVGVEGELVIRVIDEQDEVGPAHTTVPDHFAVSDESSANWVVRKIVEARAYATRVEAWAAAEVRRAERDERWFLDRFGPQLERWARQELAARGGRARSLKLPGGQLGFRSTPPTLQTVETSALKVWCELHLPSAVRLRVDAQGRAAVDLRALLASHGLNVQVEDGIVVSELKEHVGTTGELPPGTSMVGRPSGSTSADDRGRAGAAWSSRCREQV